MIRASTPALAAACIVLVSGCGARAELEALGERSTDARPPPRCAGWQPAGPLVASSGPGLAGDDDDLMSMIPSAGGALLAWVALRDAPTSTWRTLALGFDAAPRSPIEAHLSFPSSDGPGGISLAAKGSSFAALVADSATGAGCQFLPLDEDGKETGAAVSVSPWLEACAALAPSPDGFSFIASQYVGGAYFDLMNLDAKGSVLSRTPLPAPPESIEDGWLALHDQSFLLATTDVGNIATSVQRFSPHGAPLAAAAEITPGGWYVMPMVETSAGVLSAWGNVLAAPVSIEVRLLDEDGSPVAAASPIVEGGNGAVQNSVLAPTPAGDALLAWTQSPDATPGVELHVISLGPDGAPRGAPTFLGTFEALGQLEALVAPDGRRALLAFSAAQAGSGFRVLALPLACAP